jgi:hypothetical protein
MNPEMQQKGIDPPPHFLKTFDGEIYSLAPTPDSGARALVWRNESWVIGDSIGASWVSSFLTRGEAISSIGRKAVEVLSKE